MDWVQASKWSSFVTCFFAMGSAIAWSLSAMVAVPFNARHKDGEYKQEQRYLMDRKGRKIDIPETVQRQAEFNKWAAVLSAIAAVSLAVQTFFQAQTLG
ncbi:MULTISPECIES: hypothetical protein [Pseudomonas]|uniref:hypothetical protein n=1 Tax=Pseudomonas TaxID=286 RepID=UPI00300A56BD